MKRLLEDKEAMKSLQDAIRVGMDESVNGKIAKLRAEVLEGNALQAKAIENVQISIKEVLEVFNETSGFFKVTMKVAKFLIPVSTVIGIVWGFIKYFKI